MSNQFTRAIRHFSSLDACVQHIRSSYGPNKTVKTAAEDIKSGERFVVDEAPAYLYRGESYSYPTTPSFMRRMKTNPALPTDVKDVIEEVARRVDEGMQDMLELEPMLSAGFLQHYGIPTELLDVTDSLDVAAYFASGKEVGKKGLICVFPLDVVSQNSIVIDLRNHPGAIRPLRQSAWALWNKQHIDIKSQDCIEQLQLKWFSFELQNKDILKYHKTNDDLLDARTDPVAGMIQFLIDNMPKMDDCAAKWLSKSVVPAPVVTKVIDWHSPGQPKTVEPIPRSETSIKYDEKKERENNYKRWSDKFSETEGHRLVKKLGEILHSIFPSEEVLGRLEPNWPDGKSIDFLIPSHKMAFAYQDSDTPDTRILEAEQWCSVNGYRLIKIDGSDAVTESSLRSRLEEILSKKL